MTNHFAPARNPLWFQDARKLNSALVTAAANDNGYPSETSVPSDRTLHAALRYFAEHGLGAARAARAQAEQAFFAGDRNEYEWWLGITRTLDRRLAAQAEKHIPAAKPLLQAANEQGAQEG